MLQNSRATAFTVFELLRENQLGGGKITLSPPPTPRIRVNDIDKSVHGKFFIILQLEDIKKIEKNLVCTYFKKPGFPIVQ